MSNEFLHGVLSVVKCNAFFSSAKVRSSVLEGLFLCGSVECAVG